MEAFKQSLVDDFFNQNQEAWNLFNQVITDIDANGQKKENGAVCVLGGFIGEFLLVLSSIEEIAQKEEHKENIAHILTWNYQKVIFS